MKEDDRYYHAIMQLFKYAMQRCAQECTKRNRIRPLVQLVNEYNHSGLKFTIIRCAL
jgi:hypothetical protein